MVWCQFDGKIVFNAAVHPLQFLLCSLFFSLRFASFPIYSSFSLVFSIFFRCVYSFFYVPIKSHGNMYNTPTTLMWFIVSFLEFAFDTRNHPISKLTIGNLASKKFRVFQLFSFHLSNVGFDVGIRKRLEFVPKMPSKSNSYSLNIYYSHSEYFFLYQVN